MKTSKRDYDVRIEYDQGFESLCVEQKADDAEAVIAAMKIIQKKRLRNGCYHPIKSVSVALASHEVYRKED